jgi:hypothetical protein
MADERTDRIDPNQPDVERDADHARDNPDPITGAPGSHPVGTGIGAAGGGAAGAAIGAVAGPPGAIAGAVVGAAIGAVAGGYAGKGVAEAINPTAEDAYWRENYRNRPYVRHGAEYDEYRPAYQYGWEAREHHAGRTFEEAEADLQREWESRPEEDRMEWAEARQPARDAWDRLEPRRPDRPAEGPHPGATAAEPGTAGVQPSHPGAVAPPSAQPGIGPQALPGTPRPEGASDWERERGRS